MVVNSVVKLAFVGCGKIARVHLKGLQSVVAPERAVVTTLVDVNVGAAVEFNKLFDNTCQVFQSLDEANKTGDYEAVVIMVPHDLHLELATACLKAGKHVLLEKPLATTIQDCMTLIELSKTTDKVFMAVENAVFWPEVVRAKQLIKDGTIGDVYYAQANFWESIGFKQFGDDNISQWRSDPTRVGGGMVMDGTIHWIRSLRILMGEIKQVIGISSCPWSSIKDESLAHALVEFDSGKSGVIHCHVNDIPMESIPFFQIFGTKGEITIHGDFNGGITIRTKDVPNTVVTEQPGGYVGGFGPHMDHFISSVEKGERLDETDTNCVLEGARDVAIAKAIYKSIDTKTWETTKFDNLMS